VFTGLTPSPPPHVHKLLPHSLFLTHTTDLQMVNMSLRFLSKPNEEKLSNIFKV
jgi:hypothetical protein